MPTRTRKPVSTIQPAVRPAVKSVDTSAPRRKGSAPDSPPPDTHPKLPHERDQSVEATDGTPSVEIEQAYRDVSRGLQDTDRGPEADRTYKKLQR